MIDLPEVPPGPAAWKEFMELVVEAIAARTPIATETCDVNETTTGFEIIPLIDPAPAAFAGTYKLYTITPSPTFGSTPLTIFLSIPGLDEDSIITIEHNSNNQSLILANYKAETSGVSATYANPPYGMVQLDYPLIVKVFRPAVGPTRLP
jgi:hypothetical protein